MTKYKVVFCGTPDFSLPSLELLHNHPLVEITKVITMPDRPAGRGKNLQSPPVAEYAKNNKLPLIQTENINKEMQLIEELESVKVDFFVVLAFAQFLSSKILNIPRLGCFNIHTSQLPRHRGAAPIQYAILSGDSVTGVSIQKMVKKMDAGDVAVNHPIDIQDYETGGMLYNRLKFACSEALVELIDKIHSNKLTLTAQNENDVCFAPTLKREDGKINFFTEDAQKIERKSRALFPWPGTWTILNGKRLKVLSLTLSTLNPGPGEVNTSQGTLVVGCKTGAIRLNEIQLEGKKACSDSDYLNGLKSSGKNIELIFGDK